MASFGSKGLRDRDRFDKPDKADQDSGWQQLQPQIGIERGQGKRRQRTGYVTDDPDAAPLKAKQLYRDNRHGDCSHRARFGQNFCQSRLKPHTGQQRLQPAADPEQKRDGTRPDQQRIDIQLAQSSDQQHQDLGQCVACGRDAQHMLQLTCRDQQAGRGDKPGHNRVAQKIRNKTKLQHSHRQQHQPRQESQYNGRLQIGRGAGCRDLPHRCRCHQRYHRDRADGQNAAGAKDCIGQQWQDRRI